MDRVWDGIRTGVNRELKGEERKVLWHGLKLYGYMVSKTYTVKITPIVTQN